MADNRTTASEHERLENNPVVTSSPGLNSTEDNGAVGVYDRPATTRSGLSSTLSTVLLILAILLLAFFVFQWLL
jgi:hypothetical protein